MIKEKKRRGKGSNQYNLFLDCFKSGIIKKIGQVFKSTAKENKKIADNSFFRFNKWIESNIKKTGKESNWPWKEETNMVIGFKL